MHWWSWANPGGGLKQWPPTGHRKIQLSAPAIIEAWYLGQETGTALARVLFGEVNPAVNYPLALPVRLGSCRCITTTNPPPSAATPSPIPRLSTLWFWFELHPIRLQRFNL